MCVAGLGEGRTLGVGNPDSTKRSVKIGVRTAIITWVSVKLESVETFTEKDVSESVYCRENVGVELTSTLSICCLATFASFWRVGL